MRMFVVGRAIPRDVIRLKLIMEAEDWKVFGMNLYNYVFILAICLKYEQFKR